MSDISGATINKRDGTTVNVNYKDAQARADVSDLKSALMEDEDQLFDMTNLFKFTSEDTEVNGMAIVTDATQNLLALNGTSTASVTRDDLISTPRLKPNTEYALRILDASGFNNGGSITLKKGSESIVGIGLAPTGVNGTTFTTPADISGTYWRLYIATNKTFTNAKGKFILIEGSEIPSTFVEYKKPLFLTTDTEIDSLSEYSIEDGTKWRD